MRILPENQNVSEFGLGQVGLGWVRLGQVRSDQVWLGQVGLDWGANLYVQYRTAIQQSQVRLGQVMPS